MTMVGHSFGGVGPPGECDEKRYVGGTRIKTNFPTAIEFGKILIPTTFKEAAFEKRGCNDDATLSREKKPQYSQCCTGCDVS